MADQVISYIPLVEPASLEDLSQISNELKLGISEHENKDYLEVVNGWLKSCDGLRLIEEETVPVLYPRIPGAKPARKDNPHNAWATKVTIKGEDSGLLAGKTVAIKDNVFVAGTPLTNGSKIWEGYTPEIDSTVVTRILQAGGTILGKSTCESQCFSGNSFTSASGPVLNPADRTRSAGGSSSGSAALVAAGDVDMAIGGDQGGSIRLPSSWCGCVGLKPTFGLVPVTGSLGMEPSVDHVGPMASNVTDVAKLLEVIAGYDGGRDHRQNPHVTIPKYSQLLKGDLTGVKLGYVKEGYEHATPGVKSAMADVITLMTNCGAVVEEVSIPLHLQCGPLFTIMLASFYRSMIECNVQPPGYNELYCVSAMQHFKQAFKSRAHDVSPTIKAVSLFGEYLKRKDGSMLVGRTMNCRSVLRRAYNDMLEKYDALIMPTIPFVAAKLPAAELTPAEFVKQTLFNTGNTAPFNLSGHPALTINVGNVPPEDADPMKLDDATKLPVGLQIVCKHYEEVKLLDIAFGVEKIMAQGSKSSS
ncbi:hypothetical protein EB796_002329 [Bugula neritina]|uniref:Amidase domain-containing protein n=1 Tax=Bugula neritina TaxID=10212 RepID=A0A7J7KMI3_BUGNE|nr:hypothetical protein EB796_002329 [Bugula neritina]